MLRGWSVGQTAAVAAGLTAITCAGAIASYFTNHEFYALVAASGVIVALVWARVFGHAEVSLLKTHVWSLVRRLRPRGLTVPLPTDHSIQLQGRRQWSVLWDALREAASVHQLCSIKLNVNIPHLHESFYAAWRASEEPAEDSGWRMAIPLTYGGRPVGRLSLVGLAGGESRAEMKGFLDFLEPIEGDVARIIEEVEAHDLLNATPHAVVASIDVGDVHEKSLVAAVN
jgi:hypothetical protein